MVSYLQKIKEPEILQAAQSRLSEFTTTEGSNKDGIRPEDSKKEIVTTKISGKMQYYFEKQKILISPAFYLLFIDI